MSQPHSVAVREFSVPALPRITVAILNGNHRGALAYALRAALLRPAIVMLVHPRLDVPHRAGIPLEVRELDGPIGDSLVAATAVTDMLVIEVPDRLIGRHVAQLRRQTGCLLIEVDSRGCARRVSGPAPSCGR